MCLLDIFVTHLGELVSCILKMFKLFFTRLYFNLVISKFLGSSIPSHFLMVFSILRIFFFFGFARISFLSSSISWITSLIWVDLIVKGHFSHFQCVSSSLCGRTGPWTAARWGGGGGRVYLALPTQECIAVTAQVCGVLTPLTPATHLLTTGAWGLWRHLQVMCLVSSSSLCLTVTGSRMSM